VSTLDSECFLFQSRQLPDAAAALLAAGHVISPSTRIATPLPSGLLSRHDRFRRFAGAWRLLRQEPEAACFGGGSMRLQASCGVFVDVSIPPSGAVSDQASSAGCLEVRGDVTFRHRLVSFQPPSGDVLQADLSLEESDQLIEELRARGRSSGSRWLRSLSRILGATGFWEPCCCHGARLRGPREISPPTGLLGLRRRSLCASSGPGAGERLGARMSLGTWADAGVEDETKHVLNIGYLGQTSIEVLFELRRLIEEQQQSYRAVQNEPDPDWVPWENCLDPVNKAIRKYFSVMPATRKEQRSLKRFMRQSLLRLDL
ncbi:unnamed protein product, partial [Polarella glacialis]